MIFKHDEIGKDATRAGHAGVMVQMVVTLL